MSDLVPKNNFILYNAPSGDVTLNVLLQNETIWLTQKMMAELFDVGVPAINKHLTNIFESNELEENSVISILETTASDGKTNALTTVTKDNVVVPFTLPNRIPVDEFFFRYITPLECERLQTVPDNYTSCVSNTQRYRMLGNGWTVDVIAHIFNQMAFQSQRAREEKNIITADMHEPSIKTGT